MANPSPHKTVSNGKKQTVRKYVATNHYCTRELWPEQTQRCCKYEMHPRF